MKYKCTKCKAKYFHNFFIPKEDMVKDFRCRFCGAPMVKSDEPITEKEFKDAYLREDDN